MPTFTLPVPLISSYSQAASRVNEEPGFVRPRSMSLSETSAFLVLPASPPVSALEHQHALSGRRGVAEHVDDDDSAPRPQARAHQFLGFFLAELLGRPFDEQSRELHRLEAQAARSDLRRDLFEPAQRPRRERQEAPLGPSGIGRTTATGLWALYQRRKGRDLFDLFIASRTAHVSPARVVEAFRRHLEHGGHRITHAEFEMNLHEKLADPPFLSDIAPLVAPGVEWSTDAAAAYVRQEILPLLLGEPWKRPG